MKLSLVLLLLFATAASAQQGAHDALRAELLEMGRLDQDVRNRLIAEMQRMGNLSEPSPDFEALVAEQHSIDERNIRRLEDIVAEHGWPGASMVGEEASGAAWVILQHAELEIQQRYFPTVRRAAEQGEVQTSNLAMLEDRILVGEGKEQIYGTQVVSGPDGNPMLHPVVDPENVDRRRAAVGLPPIEEYLREGEAQLGRSIGRGNLSRD